MATEQAVRILECLPKLSELTGSELTKEVPSRRQSDDAPADYGRSFPRALPTAGGLVFLGVGLCYLALAQVMLFLNDPVNLGAGFWPAAGLTMGVLLLLPTRQWGWVIAAIAAAEFGGDLAHGYPVGASLWWTAGNCIEPLLGAALIRRFGSSHGALVPVNNLLIFLVFGVVVAPLVGGSIGSIGTVLCVGTPFWQVWPKYVIGDALGVLVVAPVLLTWKEHLIRRWAGETAMLSAGLIVVTVLAFRNWPGAEWDAILPYLVVPFLTWAALRYGVRGAAWAILLTANVANVATALGYGPFAMADEPAGHAVTLLQVFLAIAASTTLILAALVNDLIDRVQTEGVLKHQALHDSLTGMLNRAGLQEGFERALRRSRHGSGRISLLLCDLDDLKRINDGLGHLAGDEVLVEVARRMQCGLRADDLVARLGGDEFVFLIDEDDDEQIKAIAERVLNEISEPITGSFATMQTTVSIGVTTEQASRGVDVMLRNADLALYEAKELGKGRVVHFKEGLRQKCQPPPQPAVE